MADLIVFDCDGVLVDSEMLAAAAMVGLLRRLGVPAEDAMVARCFGMKQADILASIARETGTPIPVDAAEQVWPATRTLFQEALRPMPGVETFLKRLGDRPRCVASSSSLERIRFSLARTGLDRYFGGNVFSSQQVARGKPAPDLFLFAADRMGVDPRRAAVIEDSVYGIRGAEAAGMRAIGFLGGSHVQPGHGGALAASGAEGADADWDAVWRRIFGSSG